MAKAGKNKQQQKKKPAQQSGGRQHLDGTSQTVKFQKPKATNEVDRELLPVKNLDTVTFQNDLNSAVAIVLFEPTIGLINLDGTPAGVEIAPDVRVIVVAKKDKAGPFGTIALRSTDVKIFYMVLVDPKDGGGNIGHSGPHVHAQDPEIIISG